MITSRRDWLCSLLGLGAIPQPHPASESALAHVNPVCPRCGLFVFRDDAYPLTTNPSRLEPVSCECGWEGVAPFAQRIQT